MSDPIDGFGEMPYLDGVPDEGQPGPLDDPDACPHCGGRIDRDDRVRSLVEAGEAMAADFLMGDRCDRGLRDPCPCLAHPYCPVARWRRVSPKPPEKP